MIYELTVRFADGRTDVSDVETFEALSLAIDQAWKTEGFAGYTVGPA